MITKILHRPVSLAQHVVGGVARGGLHGTIAVIRKILPDDHDARTKVTRPTVSNDPVTQPPSPTTPDRTVKTPTKRAATNKAAPNKTTAKRPAAALDEPAAPADDDPVVYSTGSDVATSLTKDDLDELRR